MQKYFDKIEKEVNQVYKIVNKARAQGHDPIDHSEITLARNMAERVEGLVSAVAPQIKGSGVVERLQQLEEEFGILHWKVGLTIALEVAQEKFCKFKTKKEAMEVGIRVGFAYVTVGVVASPLEGFIELKLRKRKDGKEYFALMYSGPVRSAGGTAGTVSVLIADYIRHEMGYAPYDPTENEINRMVTEVEDYHEKVTNLQYFPSKEELKFLVKNLPVQIDGDPSEKYEVSNYKDLPRIETNRIRNGVCLVLAECISQKAAKVNKQLMKWGKDMDLKHWDFLEEFLNIQKKNKAQGKKQEEKLVPDYTFIKDLVGGRPVLTHPLRHGGFRLRYGRGRNSGFSSNAIHPATMVVLDNFIAIGTQLRTERPGKSTVLAVCDKIEGPIVRLKDGSVVYLDDKDEARKCVKDIDEILFLGDMLINYGDFFNRAHRLVPCGYNEEWYQRELEKEAGKEIDVYGLSFDEALELSQKYKAPLHPRHTFHWKFIKKEELLSLLTWFKDAILTDEKIILPYYSQHYDKTKKRTLELLGVPHKVVGNEYIVIENDYAKDFAFSLGLQGKNIEEVISKVNELKLENGLDIINKLSKIKIMDKGGTFIGARMGRPEKAKMRKMTGSPHVLFPVGAEGGRLRCFQSSLDKGKVTAELPLYFCEKCKKETIYSVCDICSQPAEKKYYCRYCKAEYEDDNCPEHGQIFPYKKQAIDIHRYFYNALKKSKLRHCPELIKGVRGTSNKDHVPEELVKGILRAHYKIYVNKDGTVRYDMTEMTLTAFKPKEIGVTVKKLKELGYDKDIYGKILESEGQIVELKCQDVILPACTESPDEGADKVLFRVANFIDDLFQKLYSQKPFYNLKSKEDLLGHLVVGLSPHTSAGVVARIIGFSQTQGFLAHPLFHSLLRRDCDGDEAAVILLTDALLNFSRHYLPAHRGAIQDAPLVLTSKIIPTEVDDMVFDMDVVDKYPLELYEAAQEYKYPWDIKIEQLQEHLGKERQYKGFGFTHDTADINEGVSVSAYKSIPTMQEKLVGQMEIARKVRAVDGPDVARLVIERHFMRDIKGNLRKFSMQQFRCVDCNEKFRRPPLQGKCLKCSGRIIFTIAEGSVVKYLEPSIELAKKWDLPPYLIQTLELTKNRIDSIFGKELDRQEGLGKWFKE